MLASNILTYSDFLKDSKEPLEIRKAMVRRYRELKSISAVALVPQLPRTIQTDNGTEFVNTKMH